MAFSPESIDTSGVLDGDGFSILINVTVLANPLVVAGGLFLEGDTILLSEGRAKLSISHVEPLLLQNPGQAWISSKSLGSSQGGASQGGN